jgi:hypothetical protein
MSSRGCCARPPVSTILMGGLPAIECATAFATQTPRTCCSYMTSWASPTRLLGYRQSIPMLVGGG